jgi:hypothetical protein
MEWRSFMRGSATPPKLCYGCERHLRSDRTGGEWVWLELDPRFANLRADPQFAKLD